MKKIFYSFIFMLLFIAVACEETLENEKINLAETNLTADWTVKAYIDNNMIFGPFTLSTQTTSENETITIKDNGEFWKFQTKVQLVYSNDGFAIPSQSSVNETSRFEPKIKILDGSIIENDSVTFNIQFEDDETPYGITYTIKGYKK